MDSPGDPSAERAFVPAIPYARQSYLSRLRDLLAQRPEQLGAFLMGFGAEGQGPDEPPRPLAEPAGPDEHPPAHTAPCADYTPARLEAALGALCAALRLGARPGPVGQIVIKVGLIEACPPERHVTAHPAFLRQLIVELRRAWPAAEIVVADGSGHERDSVYLLRRTGVGAVIAEFAGCRYCDLNLADTTLRPVRDGWALDALAIPRLIDGADLLISLAKLKTHHWAGVSLCMKNLFGIMPGSVYGYPKNSLHWAGIPRVIADIGSTVRPHLSIIDGVIGVEGNGPLNGSPKGAGLIIAGYDALTVDVVGTMAMGFSPPLIPQLRLAAAGQGRSLAAIMARHRVTNARFTAPPNLPWLAGSL